LTTGRFRLLNHFRISALSFAPDFSY